MRRYKIGPMIMTVLIVLTLVTAFRQMLLARWNRMPQPDATPRVLTESQERMLKKFGPDRSYELKVDAMKEEEFKGVTFHEVGVDHPFYRSGTQSLKNETQMGMFGPIPEQVRITWRKTGQVGSHPNHDDFVDEIVDEEIIEVGSRIPQALIDDLKRDPKGGLRLKFRMSKQGTLLGWDIARMPGYKPGTNLWYPPAYTHVGGDFKEGRPAHYIETPRGIERLPDEDYWQGKTLPQELLDKGYRLLGSPTKKLWENGWYIDKKTGQKIETDF